MTSNGGNTKFNKMKPLLSKTLTFRRQTLQQVAAWGGDGSERELEFYSQAWERKQKNRPSVLVYASPGASTSWQRLQTEGSSVPPGRSSESAGWRGTHSHSLGEADHT